MIEILRKWLCIARGWLIASDEPEPAIAEPRLVASQPARSSTANADLQDVEGPWLRGGVAPAIDFDRVRSWVLERLVECAERASGPAELAFLQRLAHSLSLDTLRLPPFPDTPVRLDLELSKEEPQHQRIIKIIESDPELVRLVWQKASNARFPAPPSSLDMALGRVGLDEIWCLSSTLALERMVFRVPGFQDLVEDIRVHGILVSNLCAAMVGQRRHPAYLAGLLHDVGKLMVLRDTCCEDERPDRAFVLSVSDELHAAIGVMVAQVWDLGRGVAAGIGFHHAPPSVRSTAQQIAGTVQAADVSLHGELYLRQGKNCHAETALLRCPVRVVAPRRAMILAQRTVERAIRDGLIRNKDVRCA